MKSKSILIFAIVAICTLPAVYADTPLYQVRSRDMEIEAFDLTVTETRREERTSTLNVPGFHKRSAPGSRWLMSAYTDLAIKRGFKYWAVVYPEPPDENIVVGFPNSTTENLVQTLGKTFESKSLLPTMAVEKFAVFCGMRRPSVKEKN